MNEMPDLLLEIGAEELPPREIRSALAQLASSIRASLEDLRIGFGGIQSFGTPRRLVVICREVAGRQRPAVREVRGPAASAAFDPEGHPTQAALGFAASQGVRVDELRILQVGDRRYVAAVIEEPGRPAAAVLPEAVASAASRLSFAKTMRWGEGEARFARPVRWVLALLGDRPLRLTVAGVRAGRTTHGHRVLDPKARSVRDVRHYFQVLRAAGVMVDSQERRRLIETQATALAAQVNGTPVLDRQLMDETVMSVEHPQVLRGRFSAAFLSLPREVLVTVMQHHQKYFAIEDRQRRLQPYFLAVRDGDRHHLGTVRQGHEWVLQARLADARFFFAEDRKRPLDAYGAKLEGLLLHAQLGTMADKTRRLVSLARHLAALLLLDGHTTEALLRAAALCKADLVTRLVAEFPELQGTVGRIYAELDGEPTEVARAIEEHYRPTGADDGAPKTEVGALLGLVDKCDTLVGAIGAGLAPTGSQDPYGLRRAAQGIVDIIQMLRLSLPLSALVAAAADGYGQRRAAANDEVIDFLRQRLRPLLIDRGHRYDLVDAALAVSGDDLLAAADRARTLQAFQSRPEFAGLYVAYDRASRILAPEAADAIDPTLFESSAEQALFEAMTTVSPQVTDAVEVRDYQQALEALVGLTDPVNRIFDDVLIMAPQPRVRANRLALLRSVVELFRRVADFSKVVLGEEKPFTVGRSR